MRTTLAAFALIAFITALVATVRTGRLSHRRRFLAIAVASFSVAQLVLALVASRTGMAGPSTLAGVLAHTSPAKHDHDDRPVLVILGSSYTSRGLDGQLLERLLAAHDANFRVAQISYPGTFAYEQDYVFEGYLRRTAAPPAVIVAELGSEASVTEKPENLFKPQVLSYRDVERSAWMLRQVWQGDPQGRPATPVDATVEIALHCLAHYTHLGFLRTVVLGEPLPRAGFQPEESAVGAPDENRIQNELSQVREPGSNPAATAFRQRQRAAWQRFGTQAVLFLQPPMASAARRAEVGGLCHSLDPDCIPLDDTLLSHLNGRYWTDLGHLNSQGAERWTRWLASALANDSRVRNALQ